jgi:K+-transporting ATPase ATPase C chain
VRVQLLTGVKALLLLTVITGLAFPLAMTAAAQLAFRDRANGSVVERDGRVVGSELLAQEFTGEEYFHARPSAATEPVSGASNLSTGNPDLIAAVDARVAEYRASNGLDTDTPVPVDAVTASGSGLDPHISLANARLQAARVAVARDLSVDDVLQLVADHTTGRVLGVLGSEGVNVLLLNLALDERQDRR